MIRLLLSVVLLIAAYHFGGLMCLAIPIITGIPTAYIVGKRFGINILKRGSHNSGATNLERQLADKIGQVKAKKLAKRVMFIDIAKSAIPLYCTRYFALPPLVFNFWVFQISIPQVVFLSLLAVFGHMYSIYLRGRGGKGASVALGAVVAYEPAIAIIVYLFWLAMRKVTKRVSSSSVLAALAVILLQWWWPWPWPAPARDVQWAFTSAALMVIVAHWRNMVGIIKGTEPYVGDPPLPERKKVAFIVPSTSSDPEFYKAKIAQKFWYLPIIRLIPAKTVVKILRIIGPFKYAEVKGVMYGDELVDMIVMAVPYDGDELMADEDRAFNLICKAIQKAIDKYGIILAGLGAHTAIVCDNGGRIVEAFEGQIPVITGNVLTSVSAFESIVDLAQLAGYDLANETIVVIGGTGSIGKSTAKYLLNESTIGHIILVGRDETRLSQALADIGSDKVSGSTSLEAALENSRLVICAVSSKEIVYNPAWFKPGTIVVEISRPRTLSETLSSAAKNVIVIAGGMYELPGDIRSTFNLGYKVNEFLACVSETFLRALTGLLRSSYGKNITYEEMAEVGKLADQCNFKLGRFRPGDDRSFDIEQLRDFFSYRQECGAQVPQFLYADRFVIQKERKAA